MGIGTYPSPALDRQPPWPNNRRHARVPFNSTFEAFHDRFGMINGSSLDLSEGGMCGTLPAYLPFDSTVRLKIALPGCQEPASMLARGRYIQGHRYGFEFLGLNQSVQTAICDLVSPDATSAYLMCPDPLLSRELQRLLQSMKVAKVACGAPKLFPVPNPYMVVIDSAWPHFVEVLELLRDDARDSRILIVALLSADTPIRATGRKGPDLSLHKPLNTASTQRLIKIACNLLGGRKQPRLGKGGTI